MTREEAEALIMTLSQDQKIRLAMLLQILTENPSFAQLRFLEDSEIIEQKEQNT